ncbi:MAG: diguanylate cyclase, partial [bacterium]|nr:diguanylate cyclase [bacterium]
MVRSELGWLSVGVRNPAISTDRNALRLLIATRDYPRILFWAGGLVLVFSVLTYFTESELVIATHLVDVGMALTLVAGGTVIAWGPLASTAKTWVFAVVGAIFILALLVNVTLQETPVLLTYAIVVLCALGPSTLSWHPYLVTAPVVIVAVAVVTMSWEGQSWIDWTTVALLSAAVGLLLLGARLRGINALADANAVAKELATTDELTRLLNRHGLLEHIPRLTSTADRVDQPVFVVFVDVRGLKTANDRFGHEFGDEVLQQAARAMTA